MAEAWKDEDRDAIENALQKLNQSSLGRTIDDQRNGKTLKSWSVRNDMVSRQCYSSRSA